MTFGRSLLAVLVAALHAWPAQAERRERRRTDDRGMTMPNMAAVLGSAWEVPPELSDRAQPGAVLDLAPDGYRTVMTGCVDSQPSENSVTNLTLQNSLSGGVGWGGGVAARVSGQHQMKVSFVSPVVVGFELVSFVPSPACVDAIGGFSERASVESLVLVQEALFARVSGCEVQEARVAVGGGGAQASAGGSRSCQMYSDQAVAVGVKTTPIKDIPEFVGLFSSAPQQEAVGLAGRTSAVGVSDNAESPVPAPARHESKGGLPVGSQASEDTFLGQTAPLPTAPRSGGLGPPSPEQLFPSSRRWAGSPWWSCPSSQGCMDERRLSVLRTGYLAFDRTTSPMVAYAHVAFVHASEAPFRSWAHLSMVHRNKSHSQGLQASLWHGVDGTMRGVQTGVLLMIPAAWARSGEAQGLQYGLVTKANELKGVQLGLVNIAGELGGLQIGLVNIDSSGRKLPLVNWGRVDDGS